MMRNDPYATLGVDPTASQAEIRKRYKRLARQYHPDLNPSDEKAEERFKEISAAFDLLSDPEKRQLYDEFGEEAVRLGFDAEKARAYRDGQHWGGTRHHGRRGVPSDDLFAGGVDLDDLLGNLFTGGRPRARSGPRRGGDLEAAMTVSLRESIMGGERQITVERPDPLGDPNEASRALRRVQLKVKIPPGIEDGQTIRLAGQGNPGSHGGPTGDLLIHIEVASHPFVRREGRDLHMDLPVTVGEAMLGARIEVPTFEGNVNLTIPAGSQGGDRLRLRGRGGRSHRGKPGGDLYVTLVVKVPDLKTDPQKARDAAERLEEVYRGSIRGSLVL